MSKSSIEWTDRTWNPITGCTRVSPGCENCYAETMSHRLAAMGTSKYQGVTEDGKWTRKIRLHEDVLDHPVGWKKPSIIFVCSMSDLFHEDVPEEFIKRVFHVAVSARRHTFLILTKRADRMAKFGLAHYSSGGWPYNVWAGTSVEDQQRADERIVELMKVPAPVRFLSVEPLLGPVDLTTWHWGGVPPLDSGELHWVIAGGESGRGARPCHLDWLRSVRDQCAAAGVPFFLKQLGSNPYDTFVQVSDPPMWASELPLDDSLGKSKRGGDDALLDGRPHHEWPTGKDYDE